MIRKYRFGNPIRTDAVIRDIPVRTDEVPYFAVDEAGRKLSMPLKNGEIVCGLGETVRGINKRGWIYRSFCSDDPNHQEDVNSLYGAHNFFLLDDGERRVGFFLDTPGTVTFDIGYTELNRLEIRPEEFDFDLYIIEVEHARDIVRAFREIIGESYTAPEWAFGYGQSRWSYMDKDEVREVVRRYKDAGIPLDMVYLDIDYMKDYKDFTIDEDRFGDFPAFVQEMKEEGIHLIPIIDAGVKIEQGYPVYEEGVKNGYFCKKENGENLVAAVWPGRVHFPDFLNPEVRKWFGKWYDRLLDMGIDGFWNDMNEPAIFYTEDHLKEVFGKIEDYKGKNLDIKSFFAFTGLIGGISNNPEDYARFYHDYDGQRIRHDRVHNLYGYFMTRAAGEEFRRLGREKDILMFSRASYIGMHRYGGIWTGDNKSWWSHILMNLQQLPALNMAGFLYVGADTGGFGSHCTRDLMLRWLGLSIFTPLFRNHAAQGTRRQELYELGDTEDFRNLIRLRYALIPYLYETYRNAVRNNDMMFLPLSFVYENDERAREIEDQLLVGESIMIAPVYQQNKTGRMVYLPEDMRLVKFRSPEDYDEEELAKGDHYVEVALNEVPVFVRKGRPFIV